MAVFLLLLGWGQRPSSKQLSDLVRNDWAQDHLPAPGTGGEGLKHFNTKSSWKVKPESGGSHKTTAP